MHPQGLLYPGDPRRGFARTRRDEQRSQEGLPLDTIGLTQFYTYVRLTGANGHWHVIGGTIRVQAGAASQTIDLLPPSSEILLGPDCGEFIYVC